MEKPILTSLVVEELTTRFQKRQEHWEVYLYIKFRRQEEQRVQDLLATLLEQPTQGKSFRADIAKSLYYNHTHTRPSVDEISKPLLMSIMHVESSQLKVSLAVRWVICHS
jgi:hypothetical protein